MTVSLGTWIGSVKVIAARKERPPESGQYFADLNRMAGTPATNQTQMADGVQVEQVLWRNDSKVEG
jgi:hypothetical protein